MTNKYKPELRYYLRSNLFVFPLIFTLYRVYIYLAEIRELFPLYAIIITYALLIFYLIYRYLFLINISWTISDEQLIYRRGVISIEIDYLELYRIYDYTEYSTFLDRIFHLKNVRIVSTDHTSPTLTIKGINYKEDLLTELRSKVEQRKDQRRIYEIANH
jgi:uncharacterized membrane protein YdbT with pleckstrin-like domain